MQHRTVVIGQKQTTGTMEGSAPPQECKWWASGLHWY